MLASRGIATAPPVGRLLAVTPLLLGRLEGGQGQFAE
jgi:hypothetical protein